MLELKNLVCGPKDVPLIEPFSAAVKPGEVIFLLGKNGAGKTSLLRTLAGVARPLAGEISFGRKPVFLPAQMSVADTLTGLDILEIYGSPKDEGFTEVLFRRPFSTLSNGEQRRILLTATFAHSSEILLLDEPFNFLDWSHSLELVSRIGRHAKRGRSFIIATHQMDWPLRIAGSKLWAIIDTHEKNTGRILSGETSAILLSDPFQNAFGLNIQILNNPLDASRVLAISRRP